MRKALATVGSGPMSGVLQTTLPSFMDLARTHAYDLVIGSGDSAGRPPAWSKIKLVRRLLDVYDVVLWIDADAIVLDASVDPLTEMPPDAWQALVDTPFSHGRQSSPCLGIWLLRSSDRSKEFLDAIWDAETWIHHTWWEQSAAMDLLGWSTEYPLHLQEATHWMEGTHWLGLEWNMIPMQDAGYMNGRIRHYATYPNWLRVRLMKTDLAGIRADSARAPGRWWWCLRRRLGEHERRLLIRVKNRSFVRAPVRMDGARAPGAEASEASGPVSSID